MTSQVSIQMFKLKKSIAAIILLDILEEDGKRENRRGKTRVWIRRREEKDYYNNIVQELMIEDTPGSREMMRITHDDFLEILMLVEPGCMHFVTIDFVAISSRCFFRYTTRPLFCLVTILWATGTGWENRPYMHT